MTPDEIRILSPTAILGYGFPEPSFEAGVPYPFVWKFPSEPTNAGMRFR